jgi:THO complex subunit 4
LRSSSSAAAAAQILWVRGMADSLDMSLDDLITKNKPSHSRGRGRRNPASASGGPAPARRRFHSRAANRSAAAPYHQLNFQQQVSSCSCS